MPDVDPTQILHQLVEPLRHELAVAQQLAERERRLQREVTGRLVAPVDAVFDLLLETGSTMRKQAEALEVAGAALAETAALMKGQAARFEHTVAALRQPVELAKSGLRLDGPHAPAP